MLRVVTPFMLDVSSEHETIRTPSGNLRARFANRFRAVMACRRRAVGAPRTERAPDQRCWGPIGLLLEQIAGDDRSSMLPRAYRESIAWTNGTKDGTLFEVKLPVNSR